ncbi:hypothetical protein COV16_06180 [Candidatus Woesearchaeota archaeon CG10_big_fil_rev_8_21_14_0_10_34_8]|nr:MAG: hypothetical protein COV16_06180 [Candidatus Woesearchaeota archaeon CG10_big_fil_rev_8_21_14_0_10_34_8]
MNEENFSLALVSIVAIVAVFVLVTQVVEINIDSDLVGDAIKERIKSANKALKTGTFKLTTTAKIACVDSDTGDDPGNYGEVKGPLTKTTSYESTKQDYCKDDSHLVEFVCIDGVIGAKDYKDNCDCEYGLCTNIISISKEEEKEIYINENMNTLEQKLTIQKEEEMIKNEYGPEELRIDSKQDIKTIDSPGFDIEGIVGNTEVSGTDTEDSSGFEVEKCSDSDDGKDYYIKGIIRGNTEDGYTGSWGDSCYSNNVNLIEWYCEEGVAKQEVVSCSNGCSSGACVE